MSFDDVLASVKKSFDFCKEGEISGTKFKLRLLNVIDEKKLNEVESDNPETMEYFNELKRSLLSYAVCAVNDEEIPEIVRVGAEGEDNPPIERPIYLRSFLDALPGTVIDKLFDMYVDLRDEADAKVSSEMKYDWFKTPEQRDKEREEQTKKMAEEAAQKAMSEVDAKEGTDVPSEDQDIKFTKLPDEQPVETPQ